MRVPIYQVDAFANRLFAGNPAAIMPLDEFLDDNRMQAIAAENNLAETAFIVRDGEDYKLRWFTPSCEVPLCGHATLASAAVVMEKLQPQRECVVFQTASGPLTVKKNGKGYVMDFPARFSDSIPATSEIANALGVHPVEVFINDFNHMAVLESPRQVRELIPDMGRVAALDRPGLIVTGPGDGYYDFISRYFAPSKGIPEDPVTGSAHCMLSPYWSKRLGKTEFKAFQASPRGGEIVCRLKGDRVELEGTCVFFLEGQVEV